MDNTTQHKEKRKGKGKTHKMKGDGTTDGTTIEQTRQ